MSLFLNFNQLMSPDSSLEELRTELYDPDKPGYIVLRQYLSMDLVRHLRQRWKEQPPDPALVDTIPIEPKRIGQLPFAFFGQRRTCYHNYLWNKPLDETTHGICFAVSLLRNQLQQTPLYFNLIPNSKRMASYRVLLSGTYSDDVQEVLPHQDFSEEVVRRQEPQSQNYLQATLFLAEHGVDYTGQGFFFTTNQGNRLYVGKELGLKPGDLMIWRYINTHGVDATQTLPGGLGFMRIVFPFEEVEIPEIRIGSPRRLPKLLWKLKERVFR
jgi:hypothetical protein